jgi:hypothetical protein
MKNTQPTDSSHHEEDPACEQYQVSDPEPITLREAIERDVARYDYEVMRYGAEILVAGGSEFPDVYDAAEFDRACAEVMLDPLEPNVRDALLEHCQDLIVTDHARAAAAVARHKEKTGCDLRID